MKIWMVPLCQPVRSIESNYRVCFQACLASLSIGLTLVPVITVGFIYSIREFLKTEREKDQEEKTECNY